MADLSIANVMTRALTTRAAGGFSLKSSVGRWLGQTIKLSDGAFWSAFFGASSNSGQDVTARSVLSLSTAWACCRLIAETIATLPLGVFETAPMAVAFQRRSTRCTKSSTTSRTET